VPSMDLSEPTTTSKIVVELAGMKEKDVEVRE
jgi:HSP20 family molecular chaperone IbpA